MADGKDIEIRIAAKGGDAAAAEIRKVGVATAELTNKEKAALDELITKREEAAEVLAKNPELGGWQKELEAVEAQIAALGELSESRTTAKAAAEEAAKASLEAAEAKQEEAAATREAAQAEAAERTAQNTRDKQEFLDEFNAKRNRPLKEAAIATGAIVGTAKLAAAALTNVKEAIESVDPEQLRLVDAAFADMIAGGTGLANWLDDPIGQLAALASGGTTVKEAFADLNEQLALNAGQRAATLDRIIARGITQVDEIKKLTTELSRANDLLDAEDRVAAAKLDRSDAAEIRGGANREDVEIRRAKKNAEMEIERINRELAETTVGLQESYDNSGRSRINAETARGGTFANKKEREDAQKKADDAVAAAEKDYADRQLAADQARKLADQARAEVRERAAAAVEALAFEKAERLASEKAKADAKAKREQDKAAAAADRAAKAALRGELDAAEGGLDATARGNARKIRGSSNRNPVLQDLANDVGKADTGPELDALKEKLVSLRDSKSLSNELLSLVNKMAQEQGAQAAKIEALQGQIRKGRDMK